MSSSNGQERPVVVVLSAPGAGTWPGLEPLRDHARVLYADRPDALCEMIAEADVLLVTDFRSGAIREAWPFAQRLRWVHATSAGVDRLLFPDLVDSGVPVTNARGIFDRSIAEYVLALVLAYAKDLHGTLARQDARQWEHRDTERIDGRTMLVVGAGSIGSQIGRLAGAAGMRVLGVARTARRDDPAFEAVHASEDMLGLLPGADYVVIAAPLTESTRGLFGSDAFQRMKPSARLINVGRGPIVQTEALLEAIREGRIAGAALDVFEQEPLAEEHPLWSAPGVIVSPHMSADFVGWREALSQQFIENFHRWLRGDPLDNVVDKGRGYGPHPEGSHGGRQ